MNDALNEIEVREAVETDRAYVIATWLHHYKSHSYFAKRIRRSSFYPFHHKIVEGILARPSSRVSIASPKGSPEVIFGFLVTETLTNLPVIHFIFVKEELRRTGIGKALIEATHFPLSHAQFTHWTFDADPFKKRYPDLNYNPYLI